jgi:hypothetical protein
LSDIYHSHFNKKESWEGRGRWVKVAVKEMAKEYGRKD